MSLLPQAKAQAQGLGLPGTQKPPLSRLSCASCWFQPHSRFISLSPRLQVKGYT